jgi:hypothetical protein
MDGVPQQQQLNQGGIVRSDALRRATRHRSKFKQPVKGIDFAIRVLKLRCPAVEKALT